MARPTDKKKRRSKGGVLVDFTGVEASARAIEDGVYLAELTKVTQEESDNGEYLAWTWKTKPKKGSGVVLFDNTSLQPQALWRLRLLLESIGEEIPDGSLDLDLDAYVGREVKVEVTNEKYEGKKRPRITGFISIDADEGDEEAAESSDEDEDEEKDDGPTKKKSRKKVKEVDEEDEDEESEDEDEEDEDEEDVPKKGKKASKSSSKFKVGTKVKFKDEDDKWVKGVITSLDDDTAMVEDAEDDEWEIETSELTLV